MQQDIQENKPVKLNMDADPKSLEADSMFFGLNGEILTNSKASLGKQTPYPANIVACELDNAPTGETYSIGSPFSPLTNESYDFNYNSNGHHFITRFNGEGICEVVYSDPCLQLSADPRRAITPFRFQLQLEKVCSNRHGKQIVFTDGSENGIWQIDVEASIATDSFSTPFFDRCEDRCAYIKKCVPEICGCVPASWVPLPPSETGLSNLMIDKPFRFMVKHVYYDGRESEWGGISQPLFQVSQGCFQTGKNFSRCVKLRVPLGNPMVDRVKIAFSDDGMSWYEAETVDKYKQYNSTQEKWYERQLAELANYSDDDCSFDYYFCNDKGRILIDPKEVIRVTNLLPREAQGILAIKDTLGYYNFKSGNCPIDAVEASKMTFSTVCDGTLNTCEVEYAKVTVRAIIHRGGFGAPGLNGFVYRMNGETRQDKDDPIDPAYFGSSNAAYDLQNREWQMFGGKARNFIVTVDGTDYWAEMKQWRSQANFVGRTEHGVISKYNDIGTRRDLIREITQGTIGIFFYQEAILRVPKGTRGFVRMVSQKQDTGVGNAQNTSTYVVGILDDLREYEGNSQISTIGVDTAVKEMYFDTTGGDVETFNAFVIADLAASGSADTLPAYSGYIKDERGYPVEGLVLDVNSELGTPGKTWTDHNGFYSFLSSDTTINGTVKGEVNCTTWGTLKTVSIGGFSNSMSQTDLTIEQDNYDTDMFADVQVRVKDCNGTPIGGLMVSISGSKARTTDGSGLASLRVRNYENRSRQVRVVLMNGAGCISMDCDGDCNPAMPTALVNLPPCLLGVPILNAGEWTINADVITDQHGLKAGGRYPIGFIVKGDCGKHSAVYARGFLDIPKTQTRGGLGFCSHRYDGTGIQLPSWADCLQIVRGANENPFELQWVVDKIERREKKVIITIQSLNDYNQRYFFKTNTVYQWKKGDRVEFIRNGDGQIFDSAVHGILNYLTISPFHDQLISGLDTTDADYFNQLIIEDDGRLANLQEGAIIEMQRQKEGSSETIYYEICATIPVNDGRLVAETGTFSTFDTYLINRVAGSMVGTFEHHSPSDFWGNRVSDAGKAHVVNKYENERRYGRSIRIASPTITNRFGDIVDKTFGAPEHGDITAAWITDARIIIAIGENDSFLAQSADDLVRVDGDGVIRAAASDQIISDAEPKIRGAFGCQYDSIGSVYFGDGYAKWEDVNKHAYVIHDYSIAKNVAIGRMQTFMRRKHQELRHHNAGQTDYLNHLRFTTGFNYETEAVYTTMKTLRQDAVFNESSPYAKQNVTTVYHPGADIFAPFVSFTPESYSHVFINDEAGCAFLSYFRGIPYVHPIHTDTYNEFYGIACDWIVGVSMNKHAGKIKEGLSLEVQSVDKWYALEVTTSNSGFKSEIPPIKVKKSFTKWNASFLRDINSTGGLYQGKPARDYYTKVLLIRDHTIDNRWGTEDNNKRTSWGELDMILFKFVIKEQAGFTANV